MADVVSRAVRSRMMAGIKGKNTHPEILVRKLLHSMGFRFCLHDTSLPGKPDLVFRKYKAVIFVHGCFWHGHDCHLFKWPSTRKEFWRKKIHANRQNDRSNRLKLRKTGWRILDVWECALKGKLRQTPDCLLKKTTKWLKSGMRHKQLTGNSK